MDQFQWTAEDERQFNRWVRSRHGRFRAADSWVKGFFCGLLFALVLRLIFMLV